jgi:folate-binding protein YgfZ
MPNRAFVVPQPARGILRVSGADRVGFMQGLVSNDVRLASPDCAIWSALLTPQGKYLHDFIIVAAGESLLVETAADRIGDLSQRLRRFKLRAAVTIEDESSSWEVAYGWGDDAGQPFGLDPRGDAATIEETVVFVDPRAAALGVRVLAPSGRAGDFLAVRGFAAGHWADWDRRRIRLGVPDGVRDLIIEKSILLENGFDALHGVAWDKGCYMGQELTARTKYRGLIKKQLMPVRLAADVPAGTIIQRPDGTEAGEIRSSNGDLALALVRLDAVGDHLTAAGSAIEILGAATA